MLKALFRKQMLEVFSWLYKDKKTGKHRTAIDTTKYALLYIALFGFLGIIFGNIARSLCHPLLISDMGWLYWCIMGLIAVFLGVFGSVFNTYSSLYKAKDNDLLLSMPIPVHYIVLTRLSGVYVMGLMYEMIVILPTIIIWLITAPFCVLGTINVLLIPWILSMLILVFSAVLGWVVAMVMTKVKHKNIITVVLSLAFIMTYYYLYSKAYSMLQNVVLNAEKFGSKIQFLLYPLYHMGLAAEGNIVSMLIFTAIICLLLALMGIILSKNFLSLAIINKGTSKNVYKERLVKNNSINSALLRKELKLFTGSATYMLNCGLGIVLMPISAVLLIWKSDFISPLISMFSSDIISLIGLSVICLMVTTNDISAPSISLEGKNLWILQSLPVSGKQVLLAKLKMHIILTMIPALIPIIVIVCIIKPKAFYLIALIIIPVLFTFFMASIGLICNLKMPNLHWSSEIIPIKQSAPTMIALFGGWLIVSAIAGSYYLLYKYVNAVLFVSFIGVILAISDGILLRWLMNKGTKIFEKLH